MNILNITTQELSFIAFLRYDFEEINENKKEARVFSHTTNFTNLSYIPRACGHPGHQPPKPSPQSCKAQP